MRQLFFFLRKSKDFWEKVIADFKSSGKINVGLRSALFVILLMSAIICNQIISTKEICGNIFKNRDAFSKINTILESSYKRLQKARKILSFKFLFIFQNQRQFFGSLCIHKNLLGLAGFINSPRTAVIAMFPFKSRKISDNTPLTPCFRHYRCYSHFYRYWLNTSSSFIAHSNEGRCYY